MVTKIGVDFFVSPVLKKNPDFLSQHLTGNPAVDHIRLIIRVAL